MAHSRLSPRFRRLILPLVLLWALSAGTRWFSYDDRLLADNIGASYHVLLTVAAYDQTPIRVHHLLPLVTLGRPLDRGVRFGAAVPARDGIYYYTSFPPLGFVAPWLFFKATRLTPTVRHLMLFNFGIHLAATLLLTLLIWETLAALDVGENLRNPMVLAAGATYLFAFEAAFSHGLVYWSHSLFQPVWLVALLATGRALRSIDADRSIDRWDVLLLVAVALIGPLIEWTGYLVTLASVVVLVGFAWRRGRKLPVRLGGAMLTATAIAGVCFVGAFLSVVGFDALLTALRERAVARSVSHASLGALGRGYVQSFGVLLPFTAAIVATWLFGSRRWAGAFLAALVLAATLPLVENLLLAEHATTYHFDRLKALVTIILLLAAMIVALPPVLRERAAFAWIAVAAFLALPHANRRLFGVKPDLSHNDALLARVHSEARPCAVYGTNGVPRGWLELSVGANTYESVPSADSLRAIARARGGCQSVYLRMALDAGESMYLWRYATITDLGSNTVDSIPGTEFPRPRLRSAASVGASNE